MNSLASQHPQVTAWVHAAAGLVIFVALVFLAFKTLKLAIARIKRAFRSNRHPSSASSLRPPRSERARPRPPSRRPSEPIAMPKSATRDVDSSPGFPQVFVLFQDNVQPEASPRAQARLSILACGDSDPGKKRTRNEDSFLLLPDHSLFAVADGMGGHRGGAVASSLAVSALRDAFEQTAFEGEVQSDTPMPPKGRELATALVRANSLVFQTAQEEPTLSEMGTTLVAARFSAEEQRVYVAHVGDSRCYRFRGSTLTQLTTDHTMRQFGIDGPRANDLFRVLGSDQNVSIDLLVDVPRREDIYLLCSDGLPKMVTKEQLEATLRVESDLETALYRLIELANDAGGRDNITVILLRVLEQPELEYEPSAAQ
jgi:serine/threonine protein phosphatase PrpC